MLTKGYQEMWDAVGGALGGFLLGLLICWIGGWVLWKKLASLPISQQLNVGKGMTATKRWPFQIVGQSYTHTWMYIPIVANPTRRTIINGEGNVIATFDHEDRTVTLITGYSWDGNSGPAQNTCACLRASALHDVWCQAMDEKIYAKTYQNWRRAAAEYRKVCMQEKMSFIRAWIRYAAIMAYGFKKKVREEFDA